MQRQYFSINEVLKSFSNSGLSLNSLAGYVREEIIKPLVYLNSIPAYACERGDDGKKAIAIGYCSISAYWDAGIEIINIFDNLIASRKKKIEFFAPILREKLVGTPKVFSWQFKPQIFALAPPGFINPKPKPDDDNLFCFVVAYPNNKKTIDISLEEIVITKKDFLLLQREFSELQSQTHVEKSDTHDEDDQLLERKVIIEMFKSLMTEHAWQKVFSREKSNGLANAKMQTKKPYLYSLKLIKKWLISKGKITADSTFPTKIKPIAHLKKGNLADVL